MERYQSLKGWQKGNTHIHSTVSDGGLDFTQLAERYAGEGYRFLFRTDHWVPADAEADPNVYPLKWLNGIELDGFSQAGIYYHIVCLGNFPAIQRGMALETALAEVRKAGGLTILAHPHWTGNTLDDLFSLPFDGLEVYNHVCQWMNGKGWSSFLWDQALETYPGMTGLASDDAHIKPDDPGWNGGWVMVNAADSAQDNILDALRRGDFYSSTGPEIKEISVEGDRVRVVTSPVKLIRLVGPRYHCRKRIAREDGWLTEAEFEIPADWQHVYVQIEDERCRLAWTNGLRSAEAV